MFTSPQSILSVCFSPCTRISLPPSLNRTSPDDVPTSPSPKNPSSNHVNNSRTMPCMTLIRTFADPGPQLFPTGHDYDWQVVHTHSRPSVTMTRDGGIPGRPFPIVNTAPASSDTPEDPHTPSTTFGKPPVETSNALLHWYMNQQSSQADTLMKNVLYCSLGSTQFDLRCQSGERMNWHSKWVCFHTSQNPTSIDYLHYDRTRNLYHSPTHSCSLQHQDERNRDRQHPM